MYSAASSSSSLASIWEEVCSHNHPNPESSDVLACRAMLSKVKKVLASFPTASLASEADFTVMLNLFEVVLKGQFCQSAHSALGNRDSTFKNLTTFIFYLCNENTSSANQQILMRNMSLLASVEVEDGDERGDFREICKDLVELFQQTANAHITHGAMQEIQAFSNSTRILLKRFEISSSTAQRALLCGSAMSLEALCNVPLVLDGNLSTFIQAFDSICSELSWSKQRGSKVLHVLCRSAYTLALHVPNPQYRLVECLLDLLNDIVDADQEKEWNLTQITDLCNYVLAMFADSRTNPDLLALHSAAPTLDLVRRLTRKTPFALLEPMQTFALDLTIKLIAIRPQATALALFHIPVFSETSVFIQACCSSTHERLADVLKALFQLYPAHLDLAHVLFCKEHMSDKQPDAKKQVLAPMENDTSYLHFLAKSGTFCSTLLRIHVFSELEPEWSLETCLQELRSFHQDDHVICLLVCAAKYFPGNATLWDIGSSKLHMLLQRSMSSPSNAATSSLLNLLVRMRPSVDTVFSVPSGIPYQSYSHVDITSTSELFKTLTCLIVSNSSPDCAVHLKRIVDQVPETSELAHTHLANWEAIVFSPKIDLAVRLLLVDSIFTVLTKATSAPSTVARQTMEAFLKRAILCDEVHIRVSVARQFGCLVKFGVGARALQSTDVSALITMLNSSLEDATLKTKRRHLLVAIGSIGCAIQLTDSVSMSVLSWVLTKLSSQWMEASTSGIVERTTAREEFRRIAKAHGCTIIELFDLVKKQIYPVLVMHLLRGEVPKTTLEKFISEVLGDTAADRAIDTLRRLFPVILPYYMVKQKEDYLPTLQRIACLIVEETEFSPNLLANLLFCEVKLWIVDFVEAHVANRANEHVFALCPSITFPQYLSAAKRKILETYVLKLAGEKGLNPRAMQVLELMATQGHLPEDCEECKKQTPHLASSSTSSSAMADCRSVEYLVRNEFMFMMYSLSQTIQDKSSATHLSAKKQALRCTSRLLLLLGASCNADDFIPRVLPTLADALQDVELQTEACDTLKTLATKLSEEALEKNILGFIVALLPCFHHITFANVAADVVKWLLGAHNFQHQSTICAAYDLLPTNDPTLEIAVVAMEAVAKKRTLAMRIVQLSVLIDKDSDEISLLALTKLEHLLSEPGTNVTALLNDSGNPVIPTLFQHLLKVARSVGSRIRNSKQQQQQQKQQLVDQFTDTAANKTRSICLKCCNCLGLLGAVDPARLKLENAADHIEGSNLELNNANLAITLLSDFLIDALNAAPDSDTHMKVGLVIQEMVRFLGAENIPAKFSSTVRLFLRTNYEISDSGPLASQFEECFFHKSPSFASSIGKWVTYLCDKAQREQSKVFSSLWVLRDSNCATRMMLFVLPYAVQNVLCTCDEDDAKSILKEVQGILYRGSASDVDDGRDQLSVQAVFLLLDTLERWTSACEANIHQGEFADKSKVVNFLQSIHKIDLAEAAFRIGSFSRALFYLEAHIRATHGGVSGPGSWRQDEPTTLEAKEMELLHKIYAASNDQDPDGLKGIVALRIRQGGEPSLMEQIHELESDAKWNDALKCYEEAIEIAAATGNESEKIAPMLHEGQLRCLWRAGNLDLVVNAAEGKAAQNPKLRSLVLPYSFDALWRLGKWSQLKSALHDNNPSAICDPFARRGAPGGVSGMYTESLSRALLCAVEKSDFGAQVENSQLELLGLLSAASMESYERSYPLIVRLHGLVELKSGLAHNNIINEEEWLKARLNLTSPDSYLRSELLALRRSVHRIATASDTRSPSAPGIDKFETDNWLSLAKTARKFGDITVCESALSVVRRTLQLCQNNNNSSLKQICLLQVKIQRAKLFKEREDVHSALQTLEPCGELLAFTPKCDPTLAKFRAKALLLHTKLMLENGSLHGQPILDRFRSVLQWDPMSQKAKLHMAKYQDYLLGKMQQQQAEGGGNDKSSRLLFVVLKAYGDCLMGGNKSYFEVLPRILTLWYTNAERDLARSQTAEATGESAKKPRQQQPAIPAASTADDLILEFKDTFPVSIWYTALAQLVSHICNPHERVWEITKQILINILSHYPAKALWSVMGVYSSKADNRKNRGSELLRSFNEHGVYRKSSSTSSHSSSTSSEGTMRLSKATASHYVNVSVRVFETFIKLADDKSESKVKPNAMFTKVPPLPSHASGSSSATESGGSHYGLVLPILSCLREDETCPVLFQAVGEKVEVMRSKEKPKKIRLIGTNGKTYNFLCKREERGDLRKDARLMEFNAVVNALFMRDVQAQRRGLKVRTYNVVCLNESCGLLEWVEYTMGFKSQLIGLYSADLVFQARAQVERIQQECLGNKQRLRDRYLDEVLSTLPPRFHKWFLNNFSDPAVWLNARTAFTRSSAVWSMMGYVLGLGDRHAENLLLDMKTGEAVHVDFDCLFDKGLTLKKPEIVPFRLTRNMVDGMGVCGIEGMFRGTCEITLRVLRTNKDMLLSVLESFVVDPLVEWIKRGVPSGSNNNDHGGPNPEAKETLRIVTERLSGVVRDRETMTRNAQNAKRLHKSRSIDINTTGADFASVSFEAIPLSYAGQVDRLICEAIDEEKLCQMFCGWCSFL